MVQLGIENLVHSPPDYLQGKRLGLLCNQSSTDRNFVHSRDLIARAFAGQLTCIFSPQHGFFSEKQDNMIESGHGEDAVTGIPIFSLYGETRKPTAEMFGNLDILLIDLQDVGTRVYTFLYTMAYCMETAAATGKKIVVLDRPNPVGGTIIEGNILRETCRSFVGLYPIPMRHGLTFGELALLLNNEYETGCDLEIIPMQGWQRRMFFDDTGLPWVFPSPNMPTPQTAMVYPGQVIWEGTNISEGRGTTLPFELFGAPFFDHETILDTLDRDDITGCTLRPLVFEPTSGKWAGSACRGFQLHVTDPETYHSYRTSLALLQAVLLLYPDNFQYKKPPYEYEYEKLPMDLILGDREVRLALEQGVKISEIVQGWQGELQEFDRLRQGFMLYS